MGVKNINVAVGGHQSGDYPKVYNTVYIKPNIPFALQVTEPDTKYVIRHKIDLGGKGDAVSDVDFTNAGTHEIAGVEYYYVPFTANGKPYTLLDDSCVFITSDWTGLSERTITPDEGTVFMIASMTGGLHTGAYINAEVVTMPENCILEFDGGSLDNGVIVGQDTLFINVGDVEIWGEDLVRQGTWNEKQGGVQSDWNQTDPDALDYIKNKPSVYTKTESDLRFQPIGNYQPAGNYAPASDTVRIEALEEAVGTGGSVDERIDAAKTELNGTINDTKQELEESIGSEEEARIFADNEHSLQIANRYTKEETNNIVSRTPETDVIVIDVPAASQSDIAGWLDANTPSGTDPETGRSVRANKLYRVPGPTNETYSEWAWDGTEYIPLANKDYGIDDTPKYGSDNMTKGNGIALGDETSIQSLILNDIIRSAFCKLDSPYIEITLGQYIPTNNAELGKILDTTPQSASPATGYAMVGCSPGSIFAIYNFSETTDIIGGSGARLYCFLDSSNKVLAVAPPSFKLPMGGHMVVAAPLNAAKVIFQVVNDGPRIYNVNIKGRIISKVLASADPFVDSTHYKVTSLVVEYNNEVVNAFPTNYNEVIEVTGNCYICYNFVLNSVRAVYSYSDIGLYECIIVYYKNGQWTDGITGYLSPGYKSRHIFDVYIANDAVFTANSVTLSRCTGIVGNNIVLHRIMSGGVQTAKTFVFTENSYLIYSPEDQDAKIVTSYSSIKMTDYIWLYYREGKFDGGLLYPNYISAMKPVYQVEGVYESEMVTSKRANQLAKINWYAKNPVPTRDAVDGISVGNHQGIPYTSCMEIDKFVGYDVSLKTFMTAANNPYSLLYTEYLKTSPEHPNGISDYGFVYHGTRATIGGYMGIVCNIFAMYSVGYGIPYDTGNWKHLAKKGVFKKADYQDAIAFEIGSIIIEPGHANIISGINRDTDGNILSIDWSESGFPFPRTTTMTVAQANTRLQAYGGVAYRLCDKNLLYDESEFVPDTGSVSYNYNNDICTFAGDYAVFREGQIIYLNYNLESVGNWTHIELWKNDVLFDIYAIDVSIHKFDLTSLNLEYGQYKARMKNGNTYSDFTYFQIIDANVSCTREGNNMRVAFNSEFGEPLFVRLCTIDGGPICIIPLTEDEKRRGYMEFNPVVEGYGQGYSIVPGGTYLKVYFASEYGRVTNDPILTYL